MDRMGMRKVKKKQVKDELDRQRQAEKKKRRLEKALATSAAIISELEKKKLKKKEEQARLEEEGAAIAEAVALHVLLEDEANDSLKFSLHKGGILDRPCNFDLFWGNEGPNFSYEEPQRCFQEHIGWGLAGISAGVVAAQAVSSLQIAEDEPEDRVVLHGML